MLGHASNYKHTRSINIFDTVNSPAVVTARMATSSKTAIYQSLRNRNTRHKLEMKVDPPSTPTGVCISVELGTTSSALIHAQTLMRSCASRGRGAGSRGSKANAQAPKSRLRAGRRRNERMLPVNLKELLARMKRKELLNGPQQNSSRYLIDQRSRATSQSQIRPRIKR